MARFQYSGRQAARYLAWAAGAWMQLAVCAVAAQEEHNELQPELDAAAIEQQAFELLAGRGVQVDEAAAIRKFAISAAAGRPISQWVLASSYLDGRGVAADPAKAFELFRAAAEQGLANAQAMLGWMYLNGVAAKSNPSQALRWLSAAAQQGDASAYYLLADMHGQGFGVARDPRFARELLVRAAQLGDINACRKIGATLIYGPPEQRDSSRGLHYLQKAAKANDKIAAYLLGRTYLFGFHVARQWPLAVRWMRRAAQAQHQTAALWLSEMYAKGLGVTPDAKKSVELLDEALAKASMAEKNEFAWELAVNPDPRLRNGELAVRVMLAALEPPQARSAHYLDTLAAAHAEVGNFDAAVAAQVSALKALPETARETFSAGLMRERLQHYREGKAFHERP